MKQMNTIEKVIGENTFYIKPFSAFVSANISGELTSLITPMLGSLAPLASGLLNESEEEGKEFDIRDIEIESVLPSVSAAFSTLDGNTFERIMKKLLIDHKNIHVCNEEIDSTPRLLDYELANEIFCLELQDMYILCFEVIKYNFGSFFKKLGTRFGNLTGIIQKVIPSITNTENSTSVDSAN